MNRSDLVNAVRSVTGGSVRETQDAVDATIGAIGQALKNDERVAIPALGIFTVTQRKERQGRNPQTGEPVHIPARRAIKFKPAKELDVALNG